MSKSLLEFVSKMGKFEFAVILIFALRQNVFGEESYSIELDGKFSQDSGPYITETLMAAKAEVREQKRDVEPRPLPPITFTGTVTLKTPGYVAVVGVNSTLEFTPFLVHTDENIDSNRVKRDSEQRGTARLGFYAQFQMKKRSPEVDRIKIYLDVTPESYNFIRPTSDEPVTPRIDFGFKGKLSGTLPTGDVETAMFGVDVGLEENRVKRQSDQQVIKVDGEFRMNELMRYGGKSVSVDKVTGQISFETAPSTDIASPKVLFYANDGRPDFQNYFETAGNVTTKIDGRPIFVEPLTVSFRNTVEELRRKRNAKEQESFELEYNGNLSTVTSTNPRNGDRFGVSAKLKLWEISTIYLPRDSDDA